MLKIYVDGSDKIGWSIDCDRNHIIDSIRSLGFDITTEWSEAAIVHNVWWNNILKHKHWKLRWKRNILVTTSNFIDFDIDGFDFHEQFSKVKKIAKGWICPSTKQKEILKSYGVKRVYYQPFHTDLDLFKPPIQTKEQLSIKYGIPNEIINNRCVIGSFQRDSLGTELTKGKWQKRPELLIELLKELPKDKFVLLLVGPRRHYVVAECKKHDIPYYYMGSETDSDDLLDNALPITDMPDLYALLDIYLITSKSEGGPKAAMEAPATKTFIMSTDVGLAGDFIDKRYVFRDIEPFKRELYNQVSNFNDNSSGRIHTTEENYKRAIGILNPDEMNRRLRDIYADVLKWNFMYTTRSKLFNNRLSV